MDTFIIYFLVCIAATVVGAITGVGGGVIIMPVFNAFSGLTASTISFLSGCTVFSMTAVSLLVSRSVKLGAKRGTLLAVGAAAGGIAGKGLFNIIKDLSANEGLVGTVQSAVMILLTVGVFVYVSYKQNIKALHIQNPAACILIGLMLGIFSAFLGIGGGPINLAVLYFFFSMDTKMAALNSLYIIFFSQAASLASTLIQQRVPSFTGPVLFTMAAGGIAGGILGRYIAHKLSIKGIDKVFKVLLVAVTLISIYNLCSYAIRI